MQRRWVVDSSRGDVRGGWRLLYEMRRLLWDGWRETCFLSGGRGDIDVSGVVAGGCISGLLDSGIEGGVVFVEQIYLAS